jgi:hypothetical protein
MRTVPANMRTDWQPRTVPELAEGPMWARNGHSECVECRAPRASLARGLLASALTMAISLTHIANTSMECCSMKGCASSGFDMGSAFVPLMEPLARSDVCETFLTPIT